MAITEKDIVICGHGSGHPSTKNMNDFLALRYSKKASNGVRKGIVCVRRPVKMTDALRVKFHDTYKSILGRNDYSQTKRSYVYKAYKDGKYYSDCSSSGMATMSKIGMTVPLYNTAGIYSGKEFETVPVKIKDGHITNPEILKVGDALLFAGDDPSRPKQIGHVEYVYEFKLNPPEKKPEPTPEKDSFTKYKVKTTGALNIRSIPSMDGKVLGVLHPNHTFTVREEQNGWGRVWVIADNTKKEVQGWVSLNTKWTQKL